MIMVITIIITLIVIRVIPMAIKIETKEHDFYNNNANENYG